MSVTRRHHSFVRAVREEFTSTAALDPCTDCSLQWKSLSVLQYSQSLAALTQFISLPRRSRCGSEMTPSKRTKGNSKRIKAAVRTQPARSSSRPPRPPYCDEELLNGSAFDNEQTQPLPNVTSALVGHVMTCLFIMIHLSRPIPRATIARTTTTARRTMRSSRRVRAPLLRCLRPSLRLFSAGTPGMMTAPLLFFKKIWILS